MRILFVADIHYSLKQLEWLCSVSPGFDLLVIGGDLLDLGGHADLDTQIVVIEKYLRRLGVNVPVAVCSGNHDLDAHTEAGERTAEWLQHLGIDRVAVDLESHAATGAHFSICSWWDGPASRGGVAAFLAAEALKARRPWIWVYHAPPDGARTSWNGKDYAGDAFLTALILEHKPDIVLSGHIHGSPFRNQGHWADRIGDTWVFNPGRQPSSTPASIVLDLDAKTATWDSEMDTQVLELAAAGAIQGPGLG